MKVNEVAKNQALSIHQNSSSAYNLVSRLEKFVQSVQSLTKLHFGRFGFDRLDGDIKYRILTGYRGDLWHGYFNLRCVTVEVVQIHFNGFILWLDKDSSTIME